MCIRDRDIVEIRLSKTVKVSNKAKNISTQAIGACALVDLRTCGLVKERVRQGRHQNDVFCILNTLIHFITNFVLRFYYVTPDSNPT